MSFVCVPLFSSASSHTHLSNSGIWAAPSEKDVLKWEFCLLGSDDTPYEGGVYHGRLTFPPDFPMAPPSIQMLTPSGRFEVGKKIWSLLLSLFAFWCGFPIGLTFKPGQFNVVS